MSRRYRTARDLAREAARLALTVGVQLELDDAQNGVLRVLRATWTTPAALSTDRDKESAFFGVIAAMIAGAQHGQPPLSDTAIRRLYGLGLKRARATLSEAERRAVEALGVGRVAIIDTDEEGTQA
jgi:hypothetical protein